MATLEVSCGFGAGEAGSGWEQTKDFRRKSRCLETPLNIIDRRSRGFGRTPAEDAKKMITTESDGGTRQSGRDAGRLTTEFCVQGWGGKAGQRRQSDLYLVQD